MSTLDVAASSSPAQAPRSADALANMARRRALSSPRIKRELPTLTRRRSVRSMKNLLPLTLHSNCYAFSAQAQPLFLRGGMAPLDVDDEPTMDACNFPELLANDLEFSSLVFAAKNMTAGAPSPDLVSDEGQWESPAPVVAVAPHKTAAASCHQPVVRFKSTAPINADKKTSITAMHHDLSDSESISSGPSFSEIEPASVRHQSVITTATSITGGRNSVASLKRLSSLGHDTNASWIDLEPDVAAGEDDGASIDGVSVPRRSTMHGDGKQRAASPFRAATANATLRGASNPFESFSKPASRTWSLQMQQAPVVGHERRRSLNHVEVCVPQRRSSLYAETTTHPRNYSFLATPELGSEPSFETPSPAPTGQAAEPAEEEEEEEEEEDSAIDDLKDDIEPWFRYVDEQDQSTAERRRTRLASKRQSHMTQTSPLDEVQTWLDSSLDTSQLDDGYRMPLPPDVVETLRVSLACFPETMLLCSSLSTETIRSYARKMKHPADESASLHTPPPSPKRWKWSNVLGQRRSVSSLKRDTSSQRHSVELKTHAETPLSATGSCAQPQWSRLRNIFPDGSDYLLDALYAHLVAYSYVSGLVPRSGAKTSASIDRKPPTPDHDRPSIESRKSKDSNDIPKKAAHLLGLQDAATASITPPPPLSPQAKRLRKKSSVLDTLRGSRMPLPAQTAVVDHRPLKEIQVGLARCISRLVTTLRAGPGEGDEEDIMLLADVNPNIGEVDPLLVRSLCEIVRCCEEIA